MWPWEHLAIAYIAYTIFTRTTLGRPPARGGALAVAFASQFPDLVDKSLGWAVGVLPSGQSLGHSLLFAVPIALLVGVFSVWRGRSDVGLAFGIGYLSHLPGDVVYPVLLGGDLNLSFLLWPILAPSGSQPTAVLAYVQELFAAFGAILASPRGVYYLGFELLLLTVALGLWVYDGTPGLPWRGVGTSEAPR
jgi:hypothetical protein